MDLPGDRLARTLLTLVAACGIAACSSAPPAGEAQAAVAAAGAPASPELEAATAGMFDDTETHADEPPHGGVVVGLGSHAAHAEVVLVPDTGEVTVYILDGDGLPGKRIAQPTILADIETSGRSVRLDLKAAPGAGESVGDASRFSAVSDELIRAGGAKVTLRWILVDGVVYSDSLALWGEAAATE